MHVPACLVAVVVVVVALLFGVVLAAPTGPPSHTRPLLSVCVCVSHHNGGHSGLAANGKS